MLAARFLSTLSIMGGAQDVEPNRSAAFASHASGKIVFAVGADGWRPRGTARQWHARSRRAALIASSTMRPCGSESVRHGETQLAKPWASGALTRSYPLSKECPVPYKVFPWMYKVPVFLSKTLRIVPETRVAGVSLIQLVPTCLRRLAWQSALRGNCRWYHAARRLHHSVHQPSGWGNSAL